MSLDLGKQFKSLLEPEMMEEGFVDQTLHLKIHRFIPGSVSEGVEDLELGPLPRWFTLYEVKLALWNLKIGADIKYMEILFHFYSFLFDF